MQITSLTHTPFETIFEAFSRAFADYEMQLDAAQLAAMLRRRGFDPALSFAAFEDDEIIAFTLNGTGMFNGIPTAYDTGTGTVAAHRGRGLATAIFEHSLPCLRQNGIRQYLLEVLQHNDKAVSVYSKLGFEVTREFYYSRCEADAVVNDTHPPGVPCRIEEINPAGRDIPSVFHDFEPSWQNSLESIRRAPDDFVGLGAFTDGRLAGYCVFEPASGDITQLAVDPAYRRRGIGSLLLREAMASNRCGAVKVINTDVACGSVNGFLASKNIVPTGKQFEMVRHL